MIAQVNEHRQFKLEIRLTEPVNPEILPQMVADDVRFVTGDELEYYEKLPMGNFKVGQTPHADEILILPCSDNQRFFLQWGSSIGIGDGRDFEYISLPKMRDFYRSLIEKGEETSQDADVKPL